MKIGVIGINHKQADLNLREILAKVAEKRFGTTKLTHLGHAFILLSTCNRTELYFTSNDLSGTHTYILNILRNSVPKFEEIIEQKLYTYFHHYCFEHLARVTSGIDSALVGETEIQGQVKRAYEESTHSFPLPFDLHYLFQKSLKIGKKVRTDFFCSPPCYTIENVLYQIGNNYFKHIENMKFLFVGASSVNQQIISYFKSKKLLVTLCNRTNETSKQISEKYRINYLDWDALHQWSYYDCIIAATKSQNKLITKTKINPSISSKKLMIDLSVPRNIHEKLSDNPMIKIINIDQIQHELVNRNRTAQLLIHKSESYITNCVTQFYHAFLNKVQLRKMQFANEA